LDLATVVVAKSPAVGADASCDGGFAVTVLVERPVEEALSDEDGGGSVLGARRGVGKLAGAWILAVAERGG
jgi:hypothetical protein